MFSILHKQHIARHELFEFTKAWLGTTVAFAIMLAIQPGMSVLQAALLAALTAGLGIVLHELGHRVVARRFGYDAHFVANDTMLVISMLLAVTGLLFAAPGAVWYSGSISTRRSGIIAAAGPGVNMLLAALFLLLYLLVSGPLMIFALAGYQINAWLGLFNMLPVGPIDGAKILDWDQRVFGAMAALGIALVFVVPMLL